MKKTTTKELFETNQLAIAIVAAYLDGDIMDADLINMLEPIRNTMKLKRLLLENPIKDGGE